MSVVAIALFGRILEPLWGPVELLRFTLVANICSALATFIMCISLYAVFRYEDFLYGLEVPPVCFLFDRLGLT